MINRILNTFIPFTLVLVIVSDAIIALDQYADKINVVPEIINISQQKLEKEHFYAEY